MILQSRQNSGFWAPEISFLGDQDGPSERELKSALSDLFKSTDDGVQIAYLARVVYEKQKGSIALCLKADPDIQDQLVNHVAKIFAVMFNTNEHLDIVFLTEQMQLQIAAACRPFFVLNLT